MTATVATGCPFCPGGLEAPEPYDVRWFPNRWPPISDARAEVVLYTPDHDATFATLGLDHFDRALGKPRIEIGHHHVGTGARQQDRRSPAIADTVARSTPTADDCDLAGQTVTLAIFHARFCQLPLHRPG